MTSVVVVDNGGGLLKAGFGGDRDPVAVVPNAVGRCSSKRGWQVADQLVSPDADVAGVTLRRPIDRGYLVNTDLEREVWDRVLRHLLKADPTSSSLLLVEPLFCPPSVLRSTDELVFEDFGFASMCAVDPLALVHLYEEATSLTPKSRRGASLVVDCGFSFCHAAPVLHNFTLNYAARRMDLGGKALTNYLKEIVSFRSVNVMDETLLMDRAKEQLCFVSLDLHRDMRISAAAPARKSGKGNPFKCTYVLPDGVVHTQGYVKDMNEAQRFLSIPSGDSDLMSCLEEVDFPEGEVNPDDRRRVDLTKNEVILTNERFLVPEMLFHPSDLGMDQAGLAECIIRSVYACHPHLHPVLFESIILTGGTTLFPRFAERLESELRPLVPTDYQLKITRQEDPILGVWRGGSLLASSPDFESMCVTKSEYEEVGSSRSRRRFFH